MSDYQIPDEVLDAAIGAMEQALWRDGWMLPYSASVRDYPNSADLRAADEAAQTANREAMARVLEDAAPLIAAAAHRAGREAAARDIADLKTKNNQLGAKLAGMRQCIKRVETLLAHWETIAPNESYPQAQRVAEFAYRDQLQRALTGEGQISHGVEVHGG